MSCLKFFTRLLCKVCLVSNALVTLSHGVLVLELHVDLGAECLLSERVVNCSLAQLEAFSDSILHVTKVIGQAQRCVHIHIRTWLGCFSSDSRLELTLSDPLQLVWLHESQVV